MDNNKSLDEVNLIAALLHGVQRTHGVVFNNRTLDLTVKKIKKRVSQEGISFLTKTLPRLGKAFDNALLANTKFDCASVGFKPYGDTKLPRFLGELFSLVFAPDGAVLPEPCVECIKHIRLVLYCYYKYELPYTHEQEQHVISAFEKAEDELSDIKPCFPAWEAMLSDEFQGPISPYSDNRILDSLRKAKSLLRRLFASFDPTDIVPRHGPGAVATRQQLWTKFRWTNISKCITDKYPLDAYFYASLGHFCDDLQSLDEITDDSLPARVVLVPKDSRGPRLISCEPVDFQWIQQGLSRAITELVERHPLTKWNVRFTDQLPNRFGALVGSKQGRYATLDLKEASDRVSVGLVRLLFPQNVFEHLMACRSSCTQLPSGKVIELNKYAPMGSALCFPVMALTIWALLTSVAKDADARKSIYVYGDDVIVRTDESANAINQLELFGLKINHNKSCTSGFFRESCGLDAFRGTEVTPVRFRTVWSSTPRPDVYTSWLAYANQLYDRRYFDAYDYIVSALHHVYGDIPSDDMFGTKVPPCPTLREVSLDKRPKRKRYNSHLQKVEFLVRTVKSPSIVKDIDGWSMLLRYFTEGSVGHPLSPDGTDDWRSRQRDRSLLSDLSLYNDVQPFSVRLYTRRRSSMLVRRWR